MCGTRFDAGPGRSTNTKPPFCVSSHVTLRTLVTRARSELAGDVEAHDVADVDAAVALNFLDDRHFGVEPSGSACRRLRGPLQNVPAITRSLRLRARRDT